MISIFLLCFQSKFRFVYFSFLTALPEQMIFVSYVSRKWLFLGKYILQSFKEAKNFVQYNENEGPTVPVNPILPDHRIRKCISFTYIKITQKFAISRTAQLSLFRHLSVQIMRTPECPYYEDTGVSLIWGHLSVLIIRTSSSDEWHLDVLKMGTLRCPYNEDVLIIKTPKCPHFKDVQPDDFTHYY